MNDRGELRHDLMLTSSGTSYVTNDEVRASLERAEKQDKQVVVSFFQYFHLF